MTTTSTSTKAQPGGSLGRAEVRQLIEQVCPTKEYQDKKVMLIVPDGTRTAPIGLLFRALHDQIGQAVKAFDVLIALGTHPPMSEKAICERLEITQTERSGKFAGVNVYNHEWDNPAALRNVGGMRAFASCPCNSSAGNPVNSEHQASTAVFSGVSATPILMFLGGGG